MAECSIKLRHEGKSYPRTCSKCKLGPCQDGQDYAGLTARIRELEAQLAATCQRDAETTARMDVQLADAEARASLLQSIVDGLASGDMDRMASGWHAIGFEAGKRAAPAVGGVQLWSEMNG